ncbi:hypothetical protein CBM2589_B120261 [Cupriavidus taiwanensis]|uniref:Uncharacterized protein n=1 Tax=Cupriavidus taiwanensis TaxID=164546 RepID=A0A975ZY18_9BURK|nr:hypothetical protein CBM2589_B120261 [Cupriavidus taiwanensis]
MALATEEPRPPDKREPLSEWMQALAAGLCEQGSRPVPGQMCRLTLPLRGGPEPGPFG